METIAQNVHWLIPEEESPCDLFLQFRGQFALGLASGQAISFDFLHKLAKARYFHVYIRKQDEAKWNAWITRRHPQESFPEKKDADESGLYGNKRAEYFSYMQKAISLRDSSDDRLEKTIAYAGTLVQKVLRSPMLDWYFQQFHEPPDLFRHSARVTFPFAIFCLQHAILTEKELESAVFASVIHELEGDPAESLKTVVSEQTLALLEKNGHPVPQEVIALIRLHDELCSGKGFPNNKKLSEIPDQVRAFTLFNHFDHYRIRCTGTRRTRFESTKKQMEVRKGDYDPALWEKFWTFWEKQVEAVT